MFFFRNKLFCSLFFSAFWLIMYKKCLYRTLFCFIAMYIFLITVQFVISGKKSRHNTYNFHPVFNKIIQHVLLRIPPRFHSSICSFIKRKFFLTTKRKNIQKNNVFQKTFCSCFFRSVLFTNKTT